MRDLASPCFSHARQSPFSASKLLSGPVSPEHKIKGVTHSTGKQSEIRGKAEAKGGAHRRRERGPRHAGERRQASRLGDREQGIRRRQEVGQRAREARIARVEPKGGPPGRRGFCSSSSSGTLSLRKEGSGHTEASCPFQLRTLQSRARSQRTTKAAYCVRGSCVHCPRQACTGSTFSGSIFSFLIACCTS
jgi:hypothetical protein